MTVSKDFHNIIARSNSDIITPCPSVGSATPDTVGKNPIDNTTNISTNIDSNYTLDNSIFGTIQDLLEQLIQNLSGLTLEQHACFVNTIALLIILFSINAITAVFYGDKLIKYLNLEMKNSIMDALKELESSTDEGKEFVKRVLELVNDKGSGINDSNQFIPWDSITNVYSEVYEVIDSLSQTQKGAVIHISFSLVILFCLFTLIGVFYGEKLIQYFKLEEKFPRLARYINLRRKFQQFYFLMNSLFILFILIFIIIFNVIIFIYAP